MIINLKVILVGLGILVQMEKELIIPTKKAKHDTTNLALKVRERDKIRQQNTLSIEQPNHVLIVILE